MEFPRSFRRLAFILVTFVTGFALCLGPLQPVFAQTAENPVPIIGPGLPVSITGNIPEAANQTYKNIYSELTRAGVVALTSALQLFLGQAAYDFAEYIATGGKGQAKLFFDGKVGEYLTNVGSDAAGEFMASLSDSNFFKGIGFNICQPRDPTTLLRLQTSLGDLGSQLFPSPSSLNLPSAGGLGQSQYSRPQPRCDFQTVLDNYGTLYHTMSDGDIIRNLEQSFDPGLSQLGSLTNVYNQFLTDTQRRVAAAASDRQEGNGFRPLEGLISGNIRTPASVIQEATNEQAVRKPGADQSMIVNNILSNAWNQGPVQLAVYTSSIFLNTLASKFMQRIFEKGLGGGFTPSAGVDLGGPDSVAIYGKTDARNANIDLRNPPAQQTADYDVVSQMQTCLSSQRGAWNCVMDQSLVQAVRSKTSQGGTTVRDALDRGFLHSDWRLIPESRTRENQDDQCYSRAYCTGNLQKMRLMRILPVGFELAANSETNQRRCDSADGCVTLKEVAAGFTNCNDQDQLDAAHPWCHLIDPNWVLTSFPQQCTLSGYTDTLVSSKLPIRKEECQDIQTCLARNDKGECTGGYGYCMAERPVYRFAADVCPAAAASCRIYTDAANKPVGYLRNTIDRAACDASNAGCLWYATARATSTTEGDNWAASTSTGARMYFKAATPNQTAATKGLETCPAGDEGCTRLYAFTPGKAALNLITNGSFEATDPTTSTDTLGWKSEPRVDVLPSVFSDAAALSTSLLSDTSYLGAKAMQLSSSPARSLMQSVTAVGGRSYVLSFYARSAGGSGNLVTRLYPTKSATSIEARFGLNLTTLNAYYHTGLGVDEDTPGRALYRQTLGPELSQDWQRFEYAVVVPSSTQGLHLLLTGNQVVIDAVQIEEGEFATTFVETFTSGLPAVFMKMAPEELQCTKPVTDTTRSPLCNNFAQTCNQTDAGCQGYRDQEGGQEVPAILSQNDLCPAMCVGYSEYRKSASSFDLVKDIDPRFSDPEEPTSTAFIPRTAGQCTQQDVGCEAFTVVDSTGRTDGATTAYSYLRACEKPAADSETYFTWEGADTTGYQLRTWSLKKDVSPFDLGPRILTKLQADQISFKEPDTCNESSWRTAADPDCRQFYDASGRLYYRYFSQTVLSTNECLDLRVARSNRADCELTGGRFSDRGECTYGAFLPESRSCNIQATSCRMFTGANSGNTQSVLAQTFRDDIAPFDAAGVTTSTEALLVGDMSLRVGDPSNLGFARTRASFASQETSLYRATFWAKAPASSTTLVVRTSREDGGGEVVIGSVRLSPEWQRFTVGLFEGAPNASTTRLTFTAPLLRGTDYGFYFDEVSVVRVQDLVYVRNNTWNTPAQCDQGLDGGEEPQAMLNCKAYTNRQNQTVNARRFTRLCRETAIGCTAFIDTRNTDESYGRKIVQPNPIDPVRYVPTTINLPADRYSYLIDDPAKRCNAQSMSCKAFGKPNLTPDRQNLDSEKPYQTVYFKDDVTRYNTALCKPSEAYCAEYKYGTVKEYFRDPGTSLCDYREAKVVSDGTGPATTQLAGWYVRGTAETPCYPSILEGGNAYGLARSGDATYLGYVGTCPEAAGECTELRDVSNVSGPGQGTAKSYFYIKNDRLDTSSCNGTVDLGRGCVLFRDMSSGSLNYNARATYEKYKAEGYKPVTPVDCRNNPENPACTQTGRCVGTRTTITRARRYSADTTVRVSGFDPTSPTVYGAAITETRTQAAWRGASVCSTDDDCRVPAERTSPFEVLLQTDSVRRSSGPIFGSEVQTEATCESLVNDNSNDANLLLKVSVDRECSQWLGCRSSETVFDPSTNRYKQVCSVPALCDKSTGQPGDQFCASYVDRSSTTTEPMLTQGAVLDAQHYAGRTLGIGQKDYSGYSIPNAFQVMDLQSVRVAIDGAKAVAPDAPYRLSQDYRLTAAVMTPLTRRTMSNGTYRYEHTVRPTQNQAKVLGEFNHTDVSDGLLIANPGLALCKHMGSGRIGYFIPNEAVDGKAITCYLPVHSNSDLLDFNNVAEKFASSESIANNFLAAAYPAAECRAQPEQDAPFPASFTTEWDTSKNPPKPVRRLAGFVTANTCEFGEDCSCTYKRVDYDNAPVSKFYNQFSNASPPGICVGGPRDGQGCIPEKIFNAPKAETTGVSGSGVNAVASANAEQLCGPPEMGGRCMASKTVTIVRGTFGNCLERDLSRTIGQAQDLTPCLTWNPTLLLKGDKDPYHYVQNAGYMPPQNSGQYYCISDARKAKSVSMDASFFYRNTADPVEDGTYAGGISKLDYNDNWVSNGAGVNPGNKPGSRIDGGVPNGSGVAELCEQTDDDQSGFGDDNEKDFSALRLVNTGRGSQWSYTETFFRINKDAFVTSYWGRIDTPRDLRSQEAALADTSIAYLGMTPIRTPNSTARLACAYNEDWVDNVNVSDYQEINQVRPGDVQWQNAFNAEFKGVLTRSTENLLFTPNTEASTNPAEKIVLKAPCVPTLDGYAGKQCYFKTWQTNYRSEGRDKQSFIGLTATASTEDGTITNNPAGLSEPVRNFETLRENASTVFHGKCESQKPYFSIRAVFQSKTPTDEAPPLTLAAASTISNTWTLAGFWVTACAGASTDEHYIYMTPRIVYGDVCHELAEVVSTDSHQDAAFTDRVWKDGNFTIPLLGITYNARYSPFSSALNTRKPGRDPLFQTGQEVAGYSPLNPPTFLAAGYRTYYSNDNGAPRDKWGFLTNIFARVYRIYRYEPNQVANGDFACIANNATKGKKCTPSVPGTRSVSADCSQNGVCRVDLLAQSAGSELAVQRCNGLSGINSGLQCLGGRSNDCHLGVIDRTPGTVRPLRQLPCLTQPGWVKGTDGRWTNTSEAARAAASLIGLSLDAPIPETNAALLGAFRCPAVPSSLRRDAALSPPGLAENWDGITWDDRLVGNRCDSPTDQGPVVTGSAGCPERVIQSLEVAPPSGRAGTAASGRPVIVSGDNRTMRVACVRGAGVAASAPGKCEVHVPAYTLSVTGGRVYEMPAFDVLPTSPDYAGLSCMRDEECAFTGNNYYYLSSHPDAAFRAIFGSARSISVASYDKTRNSSGGSTGDYRPVACVGRSDEDLQTCSVHPSEAQCMSYVGDNTYLLTSHEQLDMVNSRIINRGNAIYESPERQETAPIGSSPFFCRDIDAEAGNVFPIGACVSVPASTDAREFSGQGICSGGAREGERCSRADATSCNGPTTPVLNEGICDQVSTPVADGRWRTNAACLIGGDPVAPAAADLNSDNNSCTHAQGYVPRADLCPDPNDEFCGLIAYNVRNPASTSPTPAGGGPAAPLPTDVTLGLHKLSFLNSSVPAGSSEQYKSHYIPRPPTVAAPDIQSCATPGQCAVQGINKISLDGSSEGTIMVSGAQAKSTLRFYAWAAHDQMPLRSVSLDWGDGQRQSISDGKIKNHKPYCGVRKECAVTSTNSDGTSKVTTQGLTCNTDKDCPVGGGSCQSLGTCKENSNLVCSTDAQCRTTTGSTDTCDIRTFFGNSPEACEENYFEFTHLYTCNGPSSLPLCRSRNLGRDAADRPKADSGIDNEGAYTYRCERDPDRTCNPADARGTCAAGDRCLANLAPSVSGGCWDDTLQTCSFTPRVMVQDNWGWCTGECRAGAPDSGGAPTDNLSGSTPIALHPYGGCYSATPVGTSQAIRDNVSGMVRNDFGNECKTDLPKGTNQSSRPWVVYPGSVNLRSSR